VRGSRAASLVLAAMLAAPSVAVAAPPASPFAPLPAQPAPTPAPPPVQPVPQTSTTADAGGGLSGGAAVAIGVGALVILGGISFFIWYDARRRAPVRRAAAVAGGSSPGSKRAPKPRKLSTAERKRRKRGRAR
jgi:hypothetical protein